MSLPTIVRPQTEVFLISDPKKKVVVQAYTIGEEKLLVLAKEMNNVKNVFESILNIVERCIVKPKKLDVKTLPVFDVVKLFVTILGISKGTITTLRYRCKDEKCKKIITKDVDLNDIQYGEIPPNPLIPIGGDIQLKLKYPSIMDGITLSENMENGMTETEATLHFYAKLIDKIYQGEEVTKTDNISEEELFEWFLNLQESVLEKFKQFVESMPEMKLVVDVECSCGKKAQFVYTDLIDFFQ